jgi:hypothetical protein
MAGIVTGDTADHGAFQAAFGIGGSRRECQRGHGENGEWSSHDAMSPWKAFVTLTGALHCGSAHRKIQAFTGFFVTAEKGVGISVHGTGDLSQVASFRDGPKNQTRNDEME